MEIPLRICNLTSNFKNMIISSFLHGFQNLPMQPCNRRPRKASSPPEERPRVSAGGGEDHREELSSQVEIT